MSRRRTALIAITGLMTGLLGLGLTACAPTAFNSNGSAYAGQFFGDVGVVGHNNNLSVYRGSNIRKLSIQGNGNSVRVDEGATLYKVELFGKDNIVSVPSYMEDVRRNIIGHNSQVVPRQRQIEGEPEPEMRITDDSAPPPAAGVESGTVVP